MKTKINVQMCKCEDVKMAVNLHIRTSPHLHIGLIALAFLFFTTIADGQKSKVLAAYNYLKYEQLDKAKEAIDDAAVDPSSKDMDKTWYYRGLIYESIHQSDKYKVLEPNALDIALTSYQKALALDPKSEYKDEIATRLNALKIEFFNAAVVNFNEKSYASALNNFENVLKITPNDSTANLYAAYSAERSNNNAKTIEHYQKMISLKYDDAAVYNNLAKIYKLEKDTDKALTVLTDGRKKFPDDLDLMLSEINIYLPRGKDKEAIDLLNASLAKDPKNASLYFALGAMYDNLANPKDADGKSASKPGNKQDLETKAIDNYKKAIENKPDYFEANYNLGALYFNQAAEMLNASNSIKDPKLYAAAKQNVEAIFAQAQPYLEKALDINPKDHDTLFSLKQIYFRQNNKDKYDNMKARLDALGK